MDAQVKDGIVLDALQSDRCCILRTQESAEWPDYLIRIDSRSDADSAEGSVGLRSIVMRPTITVVQDMDTNLQIS